MKTPDEIIQAQENAMWEEYETEKTQYDHHIQIPSTSCTEKDRDHMITLGTGRSIVLITKKHPKELKS